MTRRLYYDDAYTTRFEAEVVAIEPGPDGRQHVVLDATCFYPTSGGQMHDLGTLGAATVVDVLDEDARIVHVVEGEVPAVGARIEGVIDAQRRRDHREQHTGQHVLSRILENELGLPTVSSRLGETANSLDLRVDALDETTLDRIEDLTNRVLWEGHEVHVHLLHPERDLHRLESWGLREKESPVEKKDRAGVLRVIEVEGVDHCACGGTHVRHTAEVGLVAITATERVKGGTRITFVCGARALRWRRERHRWLDRVARRLTTSHDQVDATVARLLEETKERHKRLVVVARELVAARAAQWVQQAEERTDGVRVVLRTLDADETLAAAEALRAVVQHPGTLAALFVVEGEKGQVMVGRSEGVDLDCRAVLEAALTSVGGRGGGQADHARGGFPAEHAGEVERALRVALHG